MDTAKRTRKRPSTKAAANTATPPVAVEVSIGPADIPASIRYRAYELFEQRDCEHGHDLEDWLCAESEVLAQFSAAATAK
jgi:hypothetical protein